MLDPVGPWPAEVGRALGEGSEEGNGLHNIAATLQTDSPEFADLPVTALRVPIFADMTEDTSVAESVVQEVGEQVKIVKLYIGSLGDQASGADTLEGLYRFNAKLIVAALR